MTYTKISIKTDTLPEFLPDILIAKLSEMGIESFEEQNVQLIAFAKQSDVSIDEISEFLTQMLIEYSVDEVKEENWNKKWEESFKFVEVDDQVFIYANFHEPDKSYPYQIKIHPKMAFGTGHHQTTRLVIRHMLNLDFKGKSVLDFGTGTGVLAILAEMMGAKEVLGIDTDEWSVNNALENIEINACHSIDIKQDNGDGLTGENNYDIVLANINRNALLNRKNIILQQLKSDAVLILSGLLDTDLEDIKAAYEETGLKFESVKQENEWIAVFFTR